MTDKYEEKYLKYKQKYLELKSQIGGLSIGDKFSDRVSGKNGIILSKVPGDSTDIKYKVRFDGETEDKELPRSQIKPRGLAALRSLAKVAKKNAVIGAQLAAKHGAIAARATASATASAARSAADTYKKQSPGVFAAVKRAASSAATTVSNAASATQAAVAKAVAPASPVAPAGDVNAQIKSILDASEY